MIPIQLSCHRVRTSLVPVHICADIQKKKRDVEKEEEGGNMLKVTQWISGEAIVLA